MKNPLQIILLGLDHLRQWLSEQDRLIRQVADLDGKLGEDEGSVMSPRQLLRAGINHLHYRWAEEDGELRLGGVG